MSDPEILTVAANGGPSILISEAARRQDLEGLVEAAVRLQLEYYGSSNAASASFQRSWLEPALSGQNTYVHALKDVQGTIAGMGGLEPSEESGAEAVLHSVWVNPQYRGLSLGRHVVTKILARAGSMGYKAVVMEPTRNPIARRLYETLGFVVYEKGMRLDLSRA